MTAENPNFSSPEEFYQFGTELGLEFTEPAIESAEVALAPEPANSGTNTDKTVTGWSAIQKERRERQHKVNKEPPPNNSHAHRWRIEEAKGPTSEGHCTNCGTIEIFRNWYENDYSGLKKTNKPIDLYDL